MDDYADFFGSAPAAPKAAAGNGALASARAATGAQSCVQGGQDRSLGQHCSMQYAHHGYSPGCSGMVAAVLLWYFWW